MAIADEDITYLPDCVAIPITNSRGDHVLLDPDDWAVWKAEGRSTSFFLNWKDGEGYVAFPDAAAPGRQRYLARVLLQASPNRIVKYRNDNRKDLRRANIYTVKRCSKRKGAALAA